ncbi:MAG: hypothetical protein AAGG68_03595 [Bacteroidota bacterium]
MKSIIIKDKTATGQLLQEIEIEVADEVTTVEEIIRARVRSEVETYNNKLPEHFRGLVQPSATEKTLNGFKMKKARPIDVEKQTYIALDAFQKNAYFLLVDDLQVESLSQEVLLNDDTTLSFIKLTQLVGG